MNSNTLLQDVKNSLGIVGNYQDATLNVYIAEVIDFLLDMGVTHANISNGLVSKGVADLWNYGNDGGKLSDYFIQRATQLSYKR